MRILFKKISLPSFLSCINSSLGISSQCIQRFALFHTSAYLNVKGLPVKMPSLSPTMMEGTIVKWLKQEGDPVQPGDVLCDIQTDKAVVSFETDEEGILAKILVKEDAKDIKIGTLIALMVAEGEDWTQVEAAEEISSPSETPSKSTPQEGSVSKPSAQKEENYGPSVRLLLQKYGLNADDVPADRHRGFLLKGDILKFIKDRNLQPKPIEAPAPVMPTDFVVPVTSVPYTKKMSDPSQAVLQDTPFNDIELTNMRRTIAKRLLQSKSTIAHTYSTADCSIDSLLKVRKELKKEGINVSVNDLLIKAVAISLTKCSDINCIWEGSQLVYKDEVDISVAVATDFGLITPIVKNAHKLGLEQIADTIRDLATRARENKLKLDEFQGGTFTISNLGMFGIREFKAIINPPQCAILAVGGGSLQLDEEGKPETRMSASLSYDQAAISDDAAAYFMKVLKQVLENPSFLMMDLFNDRNRKSVEFL